MQTRWFNYRPLCVIFAFLLLGSIFAYFKTDNFTLSLIIFAVVAVFILIIAIIKKKMKYFFVPFLAFVVGLGLYTASINSFTTDIVSDTPSTIQARIYSVETPVDGRITVRADSCIFDGVEINSKIIIYLYDSTNDFENIEIGSIISFTPMSFFTTDLYYYGTPNASYYSKNLKYSVLASVSNVEYLGTQKTVAEKIKERVKSALSLGLTNENVNIIYSSLFGDKDLLADSQYSVYKLSGVAHLLAVSGLHIGIIVAVINKLFGLLRIKKWPKLIILSLILFFYMYLCGFSVSIVRASIMSIMILLAPLFHREYDTISAISLAGIIIFLINPLSAFDVSFLMSFSCVMGIAMLYKPIRTLMAKTHAPNWLVDSLSISLSTMIALIFIMAYFYNTFNLISLFANILLIPLFTIAFEIAFVVSVVSLIIPFASYVLVIINPILEFINLTANVLGNLFFSNFATISFNYIAIVIYFILLLFLGRFCTAKRKQKVLATAPILGLLMVCLLI